MPDGSEPPEHYERFLYPFLQGEEDVSAEAVLAEVRESTLMKCREVMALRCEVLAQHGDDMVAAAQAIAGAFAAGRRLFAFGNGGSATDAQDLVADFVQPPSGGWRPLPALALVNDIATVTAVGNDVGFENVFVRQLIAFGRAGDVAVGISTSGNSPNIIAAFVTARRLGLRTVALVGYDGGRCTALAEQGTLEYLFVVPSTHIPRIQEAQATIYHTLWELVQHIVQTTDREVANDTKGARTRYSRPEAAARHSQPGATDGG
jgi:D-sedoheptulose 7-phosphate isomerase